MIDTKDISTLFVQRVWKGKSTKLVMGPSPKSLGDTGQAPIHDMLTGFVTVRHGTLIHLGNSSHSAAVGQATRPRAAAVLARTRCIILRFLASCLRRRL